MKTGFTPRPALLALPLALALAACGGQGSGDGAAAVASAGPGDAPMSREELVREVAMTLQACSYDGQQVLVEPEKLEGPPPADCRAMVDEIMAHTGLPANFVVTAGEVPNALAVIMLDQQRIPRRVIAFNPHFMDLVAQVTGEGRWTPASIMAHEIGHHLSGHTISEGGSRPEIELEADKFSGFVLYKMGASLEDASRAILAIAAPTEDASSTHPSRDRRAAAIAAGWEQACLQVSDDCASGTAPPPVPPTTPATGPAPSTPPARTASTPTLPTPDRASTPFKFGRFVVDETGRLDRDMVAGLEQQLYELAETQGLELALLVVDDLHGMDADEYAWAMMRQLRIGKLDLGNGGVFVVAPGQGQAGVAFAPGVAKQMEFSDPAKQMKGWIDSAWERDCLDDDGCGIATRSLLHTVESAIRFSRDVTWEIRFHSIPDVIAFSDERLAERRAGREWDDEIDQSIGSLVRFDATVTEIGAEPEFLRVNEHTVKDGRWTAVLVETEDGRETTLYMQPQTPSLMPAGTLEVGNRYSFVGELKTAGQFHTDKGVIQGNVELWMFSYDDLAP